MPYCGPTTYGGASALALAIAQRLDTHHRVEILTTCAVDYETWNNVVPAGHERVAGVHVHRFPVDHSREKATFERLSRELLYDRDAPLEQQERWMRAQGPYSSALLEYLETFGTRYDAVIFFSYLYATTYFGLPIVEDRAILAPLAHDEWPITFSLWDRFFARPRAFVYASAEEREFVSGRFGQLGVDGPVAGIGIFAPHEADAERFRNKIGITQPFVLYVGRIDPSKGCDELLNDFARFRANSDSPVRLVLVGEQHMQIASDPHLVVVGPVDEQTKWDALAACDVFVMPSPYESLSIAVLEAWTQGRPVLVNGRTETLVGQCRRSGGGLWYSNADEFAVALELLDAPTRATLGESGRRYVEREYSWPHVDQVYLSLLDRVMETP